MCLGIPMQIDRIDGTVARCSAKCVRRDVNLLLLEGQPVSAGDFVIVHVGYAIQKVSPAEARSAWELYDRMAEIERQDADA